MEGRSLRCRLHDIWSTVHLLNPGWRVHVCGIMWIISGGVYITGPERKVFQGVPQKDQDGKQMMCSLIEIKTCWSWINICWFRCFSIFTWRFFHSGTNDRMWDHARIVWCVYYLPVRYSIALLYSSLIKCGNLMVECCVNSWHEIFWIISGVKSVPGAPQKTQYGEQVFFCACLLIINKVLPQWAFIMVQETEHEIFYE